MARSTMLLISLTSIINSASNAAAIHTDFDTDPALRLPPLRETMVTDGWFYVGSSLADRYHASLIRSNSSVVYQGQSFGYRTMFSTAKSHVKIRTILRVPSKPENFPFKENGIVLSKIGADKRSITVERSADSAGGSYAVFWDISTRDPVGDYELLYYVDDKLIANYRFRVLPPPEVGVERKPRESRSISKTNIRLRKD